MEQLATFVLPKGQLTAVVTLDQQYDLNNRPINVSGHIIEYKNLDKFVTHAGPPAPPDRSIGDEMVIRALESTTMQPYVMLDPSTQMYRYTIAGPTTSQGLPFSAEIKLNLNK